MGYTQYALMKGLHIGHAGVGENEMKLDHDDPDGIVGSGGPLQLCMRLKTMENTIHHPQRA
jgi:hypothetical protein